MSIAQSSSPTGDLQPLFPSPTHSDSTLSSSSLLLTPDDAMAGNAQELNERLRLHHASISAANAAFVSATKYDDLDISFEVNDDSSHIFAHNVSSDFDADMSGASHTLAAALDFDSMNADLHQTLDSSDSFSFLGKRPTTSQPYPAFGSMLHVRSDSNSGRRHSIQPLMPSSDSSSSFADYSGLAGVNAGPRSMSISVDAFGSFAFDAAGPHNMAGGMNTHAQAASNSNFLMSPPRLTVSMSSSNSPTPTPFAGMIDDTKRRRTSEVDATPERSVEQLAQQQRFMPQQTPPNMYAYQQHAQFSVGSTVAGVVETPSSVQSSASPCRARRLSLTAVDRADHIANLTANLTLPNLGGEQPPKSAPPRANGNAMQRAQSQSRSTLSKKAAGDKSKKASTSRANAGDNADSDTGVNTTPNGNGKNQDVWPDDVEVAFWEGEYLVSFSAFRTSPRFHFVGSRLVASHPSDGAYSNFKLAASGQVRRSFGAVGSAQILPALMPFPRKKKRRVSVRFECPHSTHASISRSVTLQICIQVCKMIFAVKRLTTEDHLLRDLQLLSAPRPLAFPASTSSFGVGAEQRKALAHGTRLKQSGDQCDLQ